MFGVPAAGVSGSISASCGWRGFKHNNDVARVRADLEAARIRVSLKGGGEQIRAGAALFNNSDEIARFLDITEGWI